jgi:ribose transport system permease protein
MSIYKSSFLTIGNISNIFVEFAAYGIPTLAMTIAIICGEFDLSPSSVFAWSSILFVDLVNRTNPIVALIATLISGAIIGSINGFFVAKVKIPAFVVTLATMTIVKGVALFYTNAEPVNTTNKAVLQFGNGMFGPVSSLTIVFFAALLISAFVMKNTRFGRNIYSTGGNYEVAKFAGINVMYYKFIVFVILGVACAIGGMMTASRVGAGSILFATDLSMSTVAATVIGGTSLSGGSGSVWKTLVGLLFMAVIFNALTILGMQSHLQMLIKGVVLITVVFIDVSTSLKLKSKKLAVN